MQYTLTTTVNLTDSEFEMGTINVTFAELISTFAELIERNPKATSFVFTVVPKMEQDNAHNL